MTNLIAYSDGRNNLIEIADIIGQPVWKLYKPLDILVNNDIISIG
jgi:aminopeptidase-like protein